MRETEKSLGLKHALKTQTKEKLIAIGEMGWEEKSKHEKQRNEAKERTSGSEQASKSKQPT